LSTEPSVTGMIYQTTAAGREPIAGAGLSVDTPSEIPIAYTTSDRRGGFFLCGLPNPVYLNVSKDGYQNRFLGPIDGSQPQILEIELKRS
jgi:hypothetical protein